MGIRESKGLEFPNVIILDFFRGLAPEHQIPWRELLRMRDREDLRQDTPELEIQLKLLYTAITRCSKRLFFAETEESEAGRAFVKWATQSKKDTIATSDKRRMTCFAVKQVVNDVERMVRTTDEWRASGVDFAMEAEVSTAKSAQRWLSRALHDFERASDVELKRKAKVHLSGVDFRVELESTCKERDLLTGTSDLLETKCSAIVGALLREGLLSEAGLVCTALIRLLGDGKYSKEKLSQDLKPLLSHAGE